MLPAVTATVEHQVARVTLNRPAASNALDREVARGLRNAVRSIAEDPDVGAVLVTGAGPRFCGGGDLKAMLGAPDPLEYVGRLAAELDEAFRMLAELPTPVVAGVHGAVAGAGLALILSCDLVVAAGRTSFVPAYPGVGLTPDCGLSWLLPRAIGQQRAITFLVSNQHIDEGTAMSWGLVSEVVPGDALEGHCLELARSLAEGPRWALGQTKRLVRDSFHRTREEAGGVEAQIVTAAAARQDAVERMAGFTKRTTS